MGLTFACVGDGAGRSQAQTSPQKTAPLEYALVLVKVVDTPTEYVWTVESPSNARETLYGSAFRSLTSPALRNWLGKLPKGTYIRYTSPPTPQGEAYADAEAGVSDFAKLCKDSGMHFYYGPTF